MTDQYILRDQGVADEPYHYTQCGLDDVYLLNGFHHHTTPYGDGVTVDKAEELWEAIALNLCLNRPILTGKEFRFLRKQMDLTQTHIAANFGCDAQTVARWEKGESDINGAADRLLRLLYLCSREAEISAEELLERLATQDATNTPQVFEPTETGWRSAA